MLLREVSAILRDMDNLEEGGKWELDLDKARALSVQAATVFQPRTPVSTHEFFAGRWGQMTTLADAVGQAGLHVVIYGERGVGKSSLANIVRPVLQVFDRHQADETALLQRIIVKKNANSGDTFSSIWERLIEDLTWEDGRPGIGILPAKRDTYKLREAFGFSKTITVDDARKILTTLAGSVFIVDEFDRAAKEVGLPFTDLMKALADAGANSTIILVGVSETIDQLLSDHASINRSLVQILLPRMESGELREILTKAEGALPIKFSDEAANLIVNLSQGLPHYTHLLGLNAVRIAAKRLSAYIERGDVFGALKEAVRQAEQSVRDKHSKAVHSAHTDALYRHVLLAAALAAARSHDARGFFIPSALATPLGKILGRDVQIATFNGHLTEFSDEKRGSLLERVGQARAYRYRFRDPLLVPFVFMDAVAQGIVTDEQLADLLGGEF